MKDVAADLLNGCWGEVGGKIVDRKTTAATADLGGITRASQVAACLADGGIILKSITAVAFLAVLDAGKAVIVVGTAAEGLAGLDGHAGIVREASAGEGARSGFIDTA